MDDILGEIYVPSKYSQNIVTSVSWDVSSVTHIHNHNLFSRMAPESCIIAVEMNDHYVIIQFKLDNEVHKLYVHPDNIILTSSKWNLSQRGGDVVTFYQKKYKAHELIKLLCQTAS